MPDTWLRPIIIKVTPLGPESLKRLPRCHTTKRGLELMSSCPEFGFLFTIPHTSLTYLIIYKIETVHFSFCILSTFPRGTEEPENVRVRRKTDRRQAYVSLKNARPWVLRKRHFDSQTKKKNVKFMKPPQTPSTVFNEKVLITQVVHEVFPQSSS